jgi:hypothetical protein
MSALMAVSSGCIRRASARIPWQAAGHLGMSLEVLLYTYGHHHPDYLSDAVDKIAIRKKILKAASVKQRVAGTRVVATTVPAAFHSPVAPTLVIIGRGIWISGFNRSTIGALVLLYPVGYGVPSHRRSYEHRRNYRDRAKQYELCHAYLPFVLTLMTKLRRVQTFRNKLLKDTLSIRASAILSASRASSARRHRCSTAKCCCPPVRTAIANYCRNFWVT